MSIIHIRLGIFVTAFYTSRLSRRYPALSGSKKLNPEAFINRSETMENSP